MNESAAAESADAIRASLLLLGATVAAMLVANSGFAGVYKSVLSTEVGFDFWRFDFSHSVKDWIKSALMSVFFLYVGMEIKSEFQEGSLSERSKAILPFAAAIGGMAAPAIIYLIITPDHLDRGWAIPTATDIAFAIGVVGLLGNRVSPALKAFLLALAVIDDLGAILIIALFYGGALKAWAVLGMAIAVMILAAMNLRGVTRISAYCFVGFILWIFTLQSGINATLAGVIIALFIPLNVNEQSPLHHLVHLLRAPVNFLIMPIFAFANAGVSVSGLGLADIMQPLSLGIGLGLIIGKPLGILVCVALAIKFKIASLPEGTGWMSVAAIACLAGIGFTMSLFVGSLAFNEESLMNQVRLGVLIGSFISALLGVSIIMITASHKS